MKTTPVTDSTQKGTDSVKRAAVAEAPEGGAANADWFGPDTSASRDTRHVDNFVFVLDDNGTVRSIVEVPREAKDLLPATMQGQSLDKVWPHDVAQSICENARHVMRSRHVRAFRQHVDEWHRDFEFIVLLHGRDSVTVVARDISEAEQRNARLEALAFSDEITGLPNREWLISELDGAMERVRLQGGRAAIICLDIGDLDVVGNASSRKIRDALLCELAGRLKHHLRGANSPDESDDERYSAIARLDFNRFAVLLPSIDTGEDAATVTERLVSLLEEPLSIDGRSLSVNVAAGIALYPQDGSSAEELLAGSITAVEDARCSMTRQQKFHSGTVRMRAIERQDLEHELRVALDDGEFALAYQPIVASTDRQVVAAEALLRWPKPLFGAKAISEVIAVAEYTGLILPIGEWVFSRSCEQLRKWHEAGHTSLRIGVNVSAQEFARADLVERTARIVDEIGVNAADVVLEITERLLFRDSLDDFAVCRALKELGVSLSIDDYGTGVCSFDHLAQSPVDSVKIHPKIVARSGTGGPSRAACAAVTAMAHALDIRVVAEGVETEEQAEMLVAIGCDYLQGFHLGRPVAATELAALIDGPSAS
jgi:diguanylate cyclase (GGDEF)-like protein